ncbi:LOW QUALITY PROTEIN: uncharacterized protein [Leptinotarsa decemlineata]|uniref:LOW QUALITY PROTEIN: uncharacterized protein n=1 Tax=Leptinotarsa decemlineata TaxID=7539 RepID=UPI003D308C89
MEYELVILLFTVSTCFLNDIVLSQSIPTKTEQVNLLLNVQEVFEEVKLLTKDEADLTDKSVVYDVELMVKRAEYIMELLEKITLLRLSCDSNSVCMLEARPVIHQLSKDGRHDLRICTEKASSDITTSSDRLANVTNAAMDRGQELLDALGECSKKSGLQVIACYRNIILTDVESVKKTLLEAMDVHRKTHFKAVEIRRAAGICVDDTVKNIRNIMETVLKEAMNCK